MKFISIQLIAMFLIAGCLGAALLYTSQNVQGALDNLSSVEGKIAHEKDRIRILQAEWAFLNSPQRLEVLAKEYYGVSNPTISQMIGGTEDFPFPAPIENLRDGGFEEAAYVEPAAGGSAR